MVACCSWIYERRLCTCWYACGFLRGLQLSTDIPITRTSVSRISFHEGSQPSRIDVLSFCDHLISLEISCARKDRGRKRKGLQSAWLLWRRDLGIGSHIHILTRMYIKMGLFILLLAISNSLFPFPSVSSQIQQHFWSTIYSYTASATAGNLSYDCARGRHRTVSAAASRRHVDASLDLFARKSPRSLRDSAGKRALSARRLFFFVGGGGGSV